MKRRMNLAWLVFMTAATAAAQTYSGTAFTLNGAPGVGAGQFVNGNGDAANFSTVDNEIDSWWGLGIKALCCGNYSGYGIVFDARFGSIYTQGNVGIGTSGPNAPLDIATGIISNPHQLFNAVTIHPAGGSSQSENGTSIYLGSMTNHGPATVAGIWSALGGGGDGGVNYDGALVLGTIPAGSASAVPIEQMRISSLGNVGIGTTTPGEKLDVLGNIKLSPVSGSTSGGHITFPDGSVQSVAWTGSLCGGDYAESVDVSGSRTDYEPGDVLVLDPAHPGSFLKSNGRYSRLVAGIYSTKPGVVGRRQTTDPKLSLSEVPMAMVGIVPTKVTAENGPIEVGDLLVSSSLPAHAMRGSDDAMKTGTVIGKALGSLSAGTGVIEVLVSLQ